MQAQRLKTIKQLHDQYKKGMEQLEKCHRKQHVDMQGEIKKEMALLQKKMLMESVSHGEGRKDERERERGWKREGGERRGGGWKRGGEKETGYAC